MLLDLHAEELSKFAGNDKNMQSSLCQSLGSGAEHPDSYVRFMIGHHAI
jgi:hypothetical protein